MQEEYFNELKDKVKKVIAHSQHLDIEQIHIDSLMDDWKENKFRFYTHFPNKELIYQSPTEITVPIDEQELTDKLTGFIDCLFWKSKTIDLGNFVHANKDSFYENILKEDYIYGDIVIPKGMKLVRAFKYFIDDKELLRSVQDEASMLIQNTKITGYFCMSVHPLDYLSSSENNHNWRSCHALDGEYRAGNLSYMTDKATIICYIKSKEDTILPRFPATVPWNNKKWRMLLYVSNDWNLLISGRHYPYYSKGLEDFALETFKTFFAGGFKYTDWCNQEYNQNSINGKIIYMSRLIPIGRGFKQENDVIEDTTDIPLHYNDPLHSTTYKYKFSEAYFTPYWDDSSAIDLRASDITKVQLGHNVKCCVCGKNDCVISETMMCIDCELKYGTEDTDDFGYCIGCGRRIYYPEADDTEDGYYCRECASGMCSCANCGRLLDEDDLIFDEETGEDYCESCYDEIMFDREQEEENK